MQIPRYETLAEALYKDIEKNDYLNEIYDSLRKNYSIKLFGYNMPMAEINIKDAARFADLLAKSTYGEQAEKHHLWGQEIAILLNLLYPENNVVKYYLGSVLSTLGNYRALQSETINDFKSIDMFDSIYYDFDKDQHLIPGKEQEYFFSDQKIVYDGLGGKCFSYSGPTSMGKSFVVQTYIEECIKHGSEENYAILVPTKALINEVRSSFLNSLQTELTKDRDYRVVVSSGDYLLKQEHHFIFVMTPERFLHLLIDKPEIPIHFLFIDEAHKISYKGGRSTYYYKVIAKLYESGRDPNIIFASPSIPNPEVFMGLIPNGYKKEFRKLASKYSPVCQLKYLLNTHDRTISAYNEYTKTSISLEYHFVDDSLPGIVQQVGAEKQNLVYCSSKSKVIDYAVRYAKNLPVSSDDRLIRLSESVKRDVHSNCFLAELITKGVAYHVGYLPASIRLNIEKAFKDGYLRTIFCTSTLIEGVNLPADNLFITSYKNGLPNMTPVEFRNLIGRVGRIRYNLYGNVFLIRDNERTLEKRYIEYLENDIPPQVTVLERPEIKAHYKSIVDDLVGGDVELSNCQNAGTSDYEGLRKFALILARDIALEQDTPVRQAFIDARVLDENKEKIIRENFPVTKTNDDITLVDGYAIEGNTALFGSRTEPRSADCFTLQFLGAGSMVYRFTIHTVQISAPTTFPKGVRHIFTFGNKEHLIDDTVIGKANARALEQNYPIYMLGAMNNLGEASAFGITRIYSIKFYRGEELVADFIPCISKEGIVGVYDDVSGVFLSNAGEGELIGLAEPFIGIALISLPTRIFYQKGEELDLEGMVVEAVCESGYRESILDYQITGYDPSKVGIQLVTISYEGFSTNFSVVVEDAPEPKVFITLEEMKQYLRVDFDDDDGLIEMLIISSEKLCMDIARIDEKPEYEELENAKIAVMYAVAYQYEHREDADHHKLEMTLRSLLSGIRKAGF